MSYYDMDATEAMPIPEINGANLTSVGTEINSLGEAIRSVKLGTAPRTLDEWRGAAANSYEQESLIFHHAIIQLADVHPPIKDALADVGDAIDRLKNTEIPSHHEDWTTVLTNGKREIARIEAEWDAAKAQAAIDPEVTVDHASFENAIQQVKDTMKEQQELIVEAYALSCNGVIEGIGTLGSSLTSAAGEIMPPEVAASGDAGAIGEAFHTLGQAGLGEELWTDAQTDAGELATMMEEFIGGNGDQDFSAEKLKDIQSLLDKYEMGDPFLSRALLEEMGAEDLTEFTAMMDRLANENGLPVHKPEEWFESINSVSEHLGSAVMVGTGGQDADHAMNAYYQGAADELRTADGRDMTQLQRDWMDGMRDSGNKWYSLHGQELTKEEVESMEPHLYHSGYEYLTQLTGEAMNGNDGLTWGDEFVNGWDGNTKNSVAHDMVAWDNANMENRMYSGTYGSWWNPPLGQGYDVITDPIHVLTMGLDGAPEIANTFLASDTTFNPDGYDSSINMTRHLVAGRIDPEIYPGHRDGGEVLGKVINDAVQVNPDSVETHQVGLGFMEGYTDGLALEYPDRGLFGLGGDRVDGQHQFGNNNQALRSWSGSIVEPFLDDLSEQLRSPEGNATAQLRPDGSAGLNLSRDLRDRIIDPDNGMFLDMAFDQPDENNPRGTGKLSAMEYLGLSAISQLESDLGGDLYDVAYGEDPMSRQSVRGSMEDWGTLLYHLEAAGGDTAVAEGLDRDERNGVITDLVNKGVGMIPMGDVAKGLLGEEIGGREITKKILEEAADSGAQAWTDEWFSTNNAERASFERGSIENKIESLLVDKYMTALSGNDTWAADQPDPVATLTETYPNIADSDGNFKPWTMMDPYEQNAFSQFFTDGYGDHGQAELFEEPYNAIDDIANTAKEEADEARYGQGE